MKLSNLLSEDHIRLDEKIKNRDGAVHELAQMVENDLDRATIVNAVLEREKLGSTGIGEGVAVPHVRADFVTSPVVAFMRVKNPIDFEAIDNEPCSLFFLVLGPTQEGSQETYLQTMATISRLMRNPDLRDKLLSAATPSDVLNIIRTSEQNVQAGK